MSTASPRYLGIDALLGWPRASRAAARTAARSSAASQRRLAPARSYASSSEPASVKTMEEGKERFARFRDRLDVLVDILAGPGAPLRDRVRATTAVLAVGATCMFYLQQVDDRDKLRAIVLEIATDLTS